MNGNTLEPISVLNLLTVFIPAGIVLLIHWRWMMPAGTLVYALGRMVGQLIFVGFALTYIFYQDNFWLTMGILAVMLGVAAWIALRPLRKLRPRLYTKAFIAIVIGSVPVLLLVANSVICLTPWYFPRYMIPLAGMIFFNSMNSVSLCAERFSAEMLSGKDYISARNTAYRTALLPLTNSLMAVGLVSLPGMMTGQILAGVSPFIAVRYQIMVMCMVLGSAGISSAVYLILTREIAEKGYYVKTDA